MLIATPRTASEAPALDMTPVIDIVFNLLIFFLVASSFHQAEREMQIALPFAASSETISAATREITINVDAEGRTFVGGRPVEADELSALIKSALASNPDQKVTVRGDRTTPYQQIVRVLDLCKGAGIQEPYLDTVPLGS